MTATINNRGKRGRRSGLESAHSRQRIVQAALRCFARLGYKNTSNELIAREAGLTAGAIYNHFANKSDLYIHVFEQAELDIAGIAQLATAAGNSARQAIDAFFDSAERLYQDKPDAARFLSQVSVEVFQHTELAMPLAEKVKSGVENLLKKIIADGKASGEIAADVDADSLVELHINAQLGIAQVSLFYGGDYYAAAMRNLRNNMLQLVFAAPASTRKRTTTNKKPD